MSTAAARSIGSVPRLLDPDAGHWSIRPSGPYSSTRRYLPGTLVLETTFTTETGKVTLTDAMAFADGERGHDVGLDAPHELLRSVKGLSGRVKLRMELAPRPEYGLVKPLMRLDDAGRARTFGGSGRVALRSGVALTMADSTIRATFTVAACEVTGFALRWAPPELRDPLPPTRPNAVAERIEETAEAWRSWEAEHDIYGGRIGSSCGKAHAC